MKTTYSLLALSISMILAQPAIADTELKKTSVESEKSTKVSTKKKTITSADIDKEMQGNINDSTRYITGVDVSNTGNRFGSNGFNIRGMEGDAVAITVDGISQGESLDPPNFSRYGMFSSTRNNIEPESVKTISIIKGASSVTAGSGALGGAVMYTTKDASDFLDDSADAFGGSVKFGYDGRSSERLASVAIAKRFNDFEALAILTSREGNEVKAHDDGSDVTGESRGIADPLDNSQKNVLIKLAYNLDENKTIGLIFEDFTKDSTGQSLSRESTTYSNFTSDDTIERDRIGVYFDWEADTALFDQLAIKFDKQEVFTSGITAFDYSSRGSSYLRTEDRNYNQETTNFSLDMSKLVTVANKVHDINYGLVSTSGTVKNSLQDIRYNDLTKDSGLREGYPIIDPSWVPETDSKTFAIYAQDAIAITDALTITAGARYDKTSYEPTVDETFTDNSGNAVSDADFSAISTQLMATYDINKHHQVSASIGTAFKAPTTQQLYLNTNGTGEFTGVSSQIDSETGDITYIPSGRTEVDLDTTSNANLEAEEALNIELSYHFSTDAVDVELTAYNATYSNMIVNELQSSTFATPITTAVYNRDGSVNAVTLTGDEWFKPVNSGEVTVTGFEIDAAWHITRQLDMRFSYSHASGEYDKTVNDNTKGDKLESVAPDSAVLAFDYLGDNQQWGLSAITRYIAKKDKEESFDATFYSNSATIVDLTAFYNITDNLTLRGGLYNAFDKNYSQWQTVRHVRQGSGGFFGGVDYDSETNMSDGIARYSETGREFVVNVNYSF